MKILFWNVRGLGLQPKRRLAKDTSNAAKCTILYLQEMKLNHLSLQTLSSICGPKFERFQTLDALGSAGGLLTAWNESEITGRSLQSGRYSINTEFFLKNGAEKFIVTNVYGPHDRASRTAFLLELEMLSLFIDSPWVLVGDFNATRFSSESTKKQKKPFRFENLWYSYEGFDDQIRNCWSENTTIEEGAANLAFKIRRLRARLRTWSKTVVGNVAQKKHSISHKINELDEAEEQRYLSLEERKIRADLKLPLDSLLQQEETLWQQRLRNLWLREGDRNTKFFHISASNRMRKNQISEIQQGSRVLRAQPEIEQAFLDYYSSLLRTAGSSMVEIDWG
ncbi:uncharacterized protein [Elaeis guineensis]|uniref:uncharacterized protein n=1 Tax=Elaeis guineensis var. tenera TaxID=51953 RepID=UPI003C6DB5FB